VNRPGVTIGRHCVICGKPGGTTMSLMLKWLRELGANIGSGNCAHNICVNRLRSKLTRMR
jgi:hypothetical protein